MDEKQFKQFKASMLEELEPFFMKIYIKLEEHDKHFNQIDKRFEQIDRRFEQIDQRFEQIDHRFEQIESRIKTLEQQGKELKNDAAIIKRYHKNLDITLDMIKRLYTDLTFKVGELEGRLSELENQQSRQEECFKNYDEIKHQVKMLKDRIINLEHIVDRVIETGEKYQV